MELTIQVNPTERTVRFREVHALAAGDAYSSVTLSGVTGAQTAALQLKLFKDSSASSMLAQCSSFVEVPGHPSERRGAMTLATQALKDWYESVANDATATDTNGMPSALVNAWLVISDSVKTWAACQVPLILRAMDTNVVQGADGISPTVSLSKTGSVLTISITDVNGTHTQTVSDGADGTPGVSPTVLIDKNPSTGNTRITAVNADGSTSAQDVEVESVVSTACEGINLKTNATARDMLTCLQSILLRLGGSVSMLLLSALPCLAGPGEGTFGDLGMDDKVVTNAVQATASARAADAQAGTNYVDALRRDLAGPLATYGTVSNRAVNAVQKSDADWTAVTGRTAAINADFPYPDPVFGWWFSGLSSAAVKLRCQYGSAYPAELAWDAGTARWTGGRPGAGMYPFAFLHEVAAAAQSATNHANAAAAAAAAATARAATNYTDAAVANAVPGDYGTVSNKAMHAVQQVGDEIDVGSGGVISWGPSSSDYKLAVGSNSLATGWLFRWQWGTICLPIMEGDSVIALLSDIPSWARAPSKPSYTAQEVGAIAAADATNVVRRIVSVTSDYVWDAQAECLYRRSMENQYLYWTPVTNVNALLPENAHILEYLEEHKND